MDPDATFRELLNAHGTGDWDRVGELAKALLDWMKRGGFPPHVLPGDRIPQAWQRAVTQRVCNLAAADRRQARRIGTEEVKRESP